MRTFDRINNYRAEKNYVTYTEQPSNGLNKSHIERSGVLPRKLPEIQPNIMPLTKKIVQVIISRSIICWLRFQYFKHIFQRHQSVREPMMSMVPEEDSIHSNNFHNNSLSDVKDPTKYFHFIEEPKPDYMNSADESEKIVKAPPKYRDGGPKVSNPVLQVESSIKFVNAYRIKI